MRSAEEFFVVNKEMWKTRKKFKFDNITTLYVLRDFLEKNCLWKVQTDDVLELTREAVRRQSLSTIQNKDWFQRQSRRTISEAQFQYLLP